MRKIISVFQRNYDGDRLMRDEVVPGAEWVLAGEGIATRKFDGTCAMVRDGKLHKRYDAKHGKTPPPGFEPAQDYDPVTGHMPGWIAVGDGPEDRWFREAFATSTELPNGTYELCGPKVQGNPEGFPVHCLVTHGGAVLPDFPRNFDGMREALRSGEIEGVVFHHADGRMAKIKAKDFGFKRAAAPLGGRRPMGDNRPTIGYIVILPEYGPMGYSVTEGRCYRPDGDTAYIFTSLDEAWEALAATREWARLVNWPTDGWRICRCVRAAPAGPQEEK